MIRTLHRLRALLIRATFATVVAMSMSMSMLGASSAWAQSSRYSAEISHIDIAEKQVTLKASMGQQTMRVAPGVALDAFKPGDKVLVTFGQDGSEAVITSIELVKP